MVSGWHLVHSRPHSLDDPSDKSPLNNMDLAWLALRFANRTCTLSDGKSIWFVMIYTWHSSNSLHRGWRYSRQCPTSHNTYDQASHQLLRCSLKRVCKDLRGLCFFMHLEMLLVASCSRSWINLRHAADAEARQLMPIQLRCNNCSAGMAIWHVLSPPNLTHAS